MTIKFYKTNEPYGFMSNFWKAPIFIYGELWANTEAPYQMRKTLVPEEQKSILQAKTAREARDLGQRVTLRPDWDDIKSMVMFECVLAKFTQNTELRQQLLDTGEEILVEDSPVDFFYGCGADGTGKNMLGKILMYVRTGFKQ